VKWLAAVLVLLSMTAEAKTAKELLDACQSKRDFPNGQCFGYIEGYLEGDLIDPVHPVLGTSDDKDAYRLRFTEDYTIGQLQRAFVTYVVSHPEQESHAATSALVAAWMDHNMLRFMKRSIP